MARPHFILGVLAHCLCTSKIAALEGGKLIHAHSFEKEGGGYYEPLPPLSIGLDTNPLGAAYVFNSELPDLFVVNSKFSTEPGLYLYEYVKTGENGSPIFRKRVQVTHPFKGLLPPPGTITQVGNNIHGFWHVENNIVAHTNYDRANHGFTERRELHIQGLPRIPIGLSYLPRSNSAGDLLLEVQDRKPMQVTKDMELKTLGYRNPEYNPFDSDPDYNPWDSAKIWSSSLLSAPGPKQARGLVTNSTGEKERSLVTGSHYGVLYYFRNMADAGIAFRQRQPILDKHGKVLRHSSPRATPVVYPVKGSRSSNHLIVGGEGQLMFYKFFSHSIETGGVPVYEPAVPVQEEGALLYGGSHPALTEVDWDSDGRHDLIVGNADGRILFIRNVGTDTQPQFMPGVALKSNEEEIHIQPGYHALEGPAEARYGYACPTVIDWDGDGAEACVWQAAVQRRPRAARAVAGEASCDTRERPNGVRCWQGQAEDRQGDRGALPLGRGHRTPAHQPARLGLRWCRRPFGGGSKTCINPEPEMGLPRSLGLPGGAILFLKGKREAAGELPKFKFPEVLHYNGAPIFIGREDGGFAVVHFGEAPGPHIVVGEEGGHFVFYDRARMSCDSVNRFPESKESKKDGMKPMSYKTFISPPGTVEEEDAAEGEPPESDDSEAVEEPEDSNTEGGQEEASTEQEEESTNGTAVREKPFSMPEFLGGLIVVPALLLLKTAFEYTRPTLARRFGRRLPRDMTRTV
ncbi:hypothetical protein CYMTET_3933 [Cymbomonas tetramitiformis]|uniref:Uncharacterized protein n=1 Tax=Cymbomonas tetramitiformis TaxID=36881 RepID=A0AAE0H2A5_9CHLO|nr:hypothetical protein CYMTET_3933 [Cymbomonas tetramitiformis]